MKPFEKIGLAGAAALALSLGAATAARADALSSPAMTPPLAADPDPASFDAGALGKIYLSGQLTGVGLWQDNSIPGDKDSRAGLSNAQLEIQKTDGVFQFYVQGGAYSLPSLGTPYIKADKLHPLAVTTAMKSEALPDIPTVGTFVPGYEASQWYGIAAPRNIPVEIVEKLNREINAGLADPAFQARLADLGGATLAGSPADFGKLITYDTEKWGRVTRAANIKPG